MDKKSRINFINSVADGQKVPCLKCDTLNPADSKFCSTCGRPIGRQEEAPKEAPKEERAAVKAEEKKPLRKIETPVEEVIEEPSVFAEGLPKWDIVPPQVVVRRKRR